MTLSAKVRIEIFIPDLPGTAYQDLLEELSEELSYAFGGCTEVPGSGKYRSFDGSIYSDNVSILFSDAPIFWDQDRLVIARYIDSVRRAAHWALEQEEAILISVYPVCHGE